MQLPNSSRLDEFEFFFELSPDLLCIAGFDGFFKKVNPAWKHLLGFTTGELLDRSISDFVHPDDRERTETEARRLVTEWTPSRFENRYRCKDGTYRSLIWQSIAVREHQRIYAIAREKSGALALCVSGTSAGEDIVNSMAGLVTSYLPKPFTAEQLLRAVHRTLSAVA